MCSPPSISTVVPDACQANAERELGPAISPFIPRYSHHPQQQQQIRQTKSSHSKEALARGEEGRMVWMDGGGTVYFEKLNVLLH